MRGVMIEVPPSLLAERARTDADRFDEMWEGVLHMVPPAGRAHMRMESELERALFPFCERAGLQIGHEMGLFDPAVPQPTSYRQADVVVYAEAVGSDRGVEGAATLVVEILSPGDESFEKLPFYERVGVGEVLIIDPGTATVRHWARRAGLLVEEAADDGGALACLPVTVRMMDGHVEVTARP